MDSMRLKILSETKLLDMEGIGEAEFWRIQLDGEEIATKAQPFTASSCEITLSQCECCYQCGVPSIAVRKISNHTIIWFTNPDDRLDDLPKEDLRTFHLADYERWLKSKSTELPLLSPEELQHVFSLENLPEWKEPLYTIPELPGDETGIKTLQLIADSVAKGLITPHISDASSFRSIKFGFDIENLFESDIDFALIDDEISFRLKTLPDVPLWLRIEGDDGDFSPVRRWLASAERS